MLGFVGRFREDTIQQSIIRDARKPTLKGGGIQFNDLVGFQIQMQIYL